MSFDVLRKPPYSLSESDIAWVRETLANMSTPRKINQLFILNSGGTDQAECDLLTRLQPGGVTRRPGGDMAAELDFLRAYAKASEVPPIVTADLEGSRMSLPFGTQTLNPLGLAAVDDLDVTRETARILAEEGRAAGISWSFTPVIDINEAFRSAIVGTRSLGSDLELIERHALAQIDAFQANGVAATVKHWPGEGYDDRDQHLVTTINPLTTAEWEATFGRLYRKCIDAGVMSVMSAHIALPHIMRELDPDCGRDAYKPASINRLLNETLLREKLGFNGLIVSDATGMAGLGAWCGRDDSIPALVAAGCDIILFSPQPDIDIANVTAAVERGDISMARLDEAVTRILGLKAKQGLHQNPTIPESAEAVFASERNTASAQAAIGKAPTLVKDTQNLLPLDPKKHRRVLVFSTGIVFPFLPEPLPMAFPDMLRAEGFEVTVYEKGMEVDRSAFDLVLYIFGEENLLTRSHIFIDWLRMTGFFGTAMHRYWHDIPTVMISFGHPYYLYDAPRVPTYINAYTTLDDMQKAVVERLLGRAPFEGKNPVDPFCGLEDAAF